MKTIIIAAAALVAATGATAQSVSTENSRSTTSVGYGDLNLASRAGQTTLARRVAAAAQRVCDAEIGNTDLATHMNTRRCIQTAIASAMMSVKAQPMLAYSGH